MSVNLGKVSKNQTAVQRATAAEVFSGKTCGRCGEPIKVKDLVNVKQVDHGTGRKGTVAYHRNCYGL